jgi:alpha-1,3-glucosyltransferase
VVRCGLSTIYRHLDRVGSWPGVAQVSQLSSSDAVELISARFIRGATDPTMHRIISASLFMHPGFIIVDHIHFQYNGFMYGILLWSILMARNVGESLFLLCHFR